MEKIQAAGQFVFQVRKHKYKKEHINMAERLPCMGQSEEQESDLESYPPPHELDSILCQILIHTINSESHGFFGQFWENRPSVLF